MQLFNFSYCFPMVSASFAEYITFSAPAFLSDIFTSFIILIGVSTSAFSAMMTCSRSTSANSDIRSATAAERLSSVTLLPSNCMATVPVMPTVVADGLPTYRSTTLRLLATVVSSWPTGI